MAIYIKLFLKVFNFTMLIILFYILKSDLYYFDLNIDRLKYFFDRGLQPIIYFLTADKTKKN